MAENGEEDLKDGEWFDFNTAMDEFGFDYESFTENGFKTFLEETFIKDVIDCRRNFISRNYIQVRFWAHKFKGSFL